MDLLKDTSFEREVFFLLPIGISIAILLYKVLSKARVESKRKIPYSPYGYIETIKAFVQLQPHKMLYNSSKIVGPIFQLPGPDKMVCVADIDIIRDVLTDRSVRKPIQYESFRFASGSTNDIFTSDGSFHTKSRKAMAHAFSSNHIKRMKEVSIHHTELFVKNRLSQITESGEPFDIRTEMISLTFDIIVDAAFQYRMPIDEKSKFLSEMQLLLIECYLSQIPLRHRLGFFIPGVRRAKKAQSYVRKVAMNIIESYKKMESPIEGTVLDCIMKNTKAYKNDEERIADVITMVVGGHETTAMTISWTLIELAQRKDLQERVRSEIMDKPIEQANRNKLLEGVIKESMRLHPVGAAIGAWRVSNKDYSIDDGKYFIPKGSNLMFPPITYFTNSNYFEDPYEFKPSRWYKENPSKKSQEAFLPFAIGRRNCIGQTLAHAEIYSIIPRLIKEFDFSIETEGTDEFFLTLKPKGWLMVAKSLNH